MKLELIRKEFTEKATIGELYIDGKFFCFTCEDKDRGLKQTDALVWINTVKVFGVTAIPYGTYEIKMTMSNRFKRVLPLLIGVRGFEGVRLHRGNTAEDSHGCPLVGYKKAYNSVFESTKAENDLVSILNKSHNITIEIKK